MSKSDKNTMKNFFKNNTMYIPNGETLEEIKDRFEQQGYTVIWGYDESYKEEESVSEGYLHFENKRFFLSKDHFGKLTISLEEFSMTVIENKKESRYYSKKDLIKALKYGIDYGYHQGFSDAVNEDDYAEKPYNKNIFRKFFKDIKK